MTSVVEHCDQGRGEERQKVDFRLRNAAFRPFVWRYVRFIYCFPQGRILGRSINDINNWYGGGVNWSK